MDNFFQAFSMSTMFQGSNCTKLSDILEHLESLNLTKCALIENRLTIVHLRTTTKRFNNLSIAYRQYQSSRYWQGTCFKI